jgi:hypothetical protein
MIKHLVMFKLAGEAEGLSAKENALLIKEKLEALKGVIPQIRSMKVRVNHAEASCDNCDILLDSEFDTLEDLQAYAVHPAHLEVGAYVVKVRTVRAAIDYAF